MSDQRCIYLKLLKLCSAICYLILFIFSMCRGSLIGHPVENVRIVLTDGASHAVDSSELAFKLASIYAFRQVFLIIFIQFELYWFYHNSKFLCLIFLFRVILNLYKSVLHSCKTDYIGTNHVGGAESTNRISGYSSRWY